MAKFHQLSCVVLLLTSLGCQSMMGTQRNVAEKEAASNTSAAIEDPFAAEVGKMARKHHDYEEVKDPLGVRNYFTTAKSREIERNVGIGK
ncbi:hypothetical protein SH668x_001691 [Planctomicrobium sp. SH668]|uniref:hypothetical protein n=1 Tax=Planctomicrobium sp. SH668 TaxID=3448126 RepID=UPI003F5BC10B